MCNAKKNAVIFVKIPRRSREPKMTSNQPLISTKVVADMPVISVYIGGIRLVHKVVSESCCQPNHKNTKDIPILKTNGAALRIFSMELFYHLNFIPTIPQFYYSKNSESSQS